MKFRRDLRERAETSYRVRRTNGVSWYRSRAVVDGLAVVVKRFPRVAPVENPSRNYVLVHGLGVSSHYFEWLAAALARDANVWLVDLPGYGSSPKPRRDVTVEEHARVLGLVIDSSKVSNPVLVGHSMGCQVVTEIAVTMPHLSDSLVLLSPVTNPLRRSQGQQLLDLVRDFFREPPRADAFGLYSYFLTGRILYYLKQVPHMIGYPIEDRLRLVQAETLVVVGERDPIVPLEWATQAAALPARGSLAVVPGAHVIMYSAPRILSERIVKHAEHVAP